jgi:predicted membrane chloride channel (bestrophin family)
MRFPIILNFDSKIIYIILVSITVTIIFKYDKQYKKNFFQEIASLTSITISIICLYIRKKKIEF